MLLFNHHKKIKKGYNIVKIFLRKSYIIQGENMYINDLKYLNLFAEEKEEKFIITFATLNGEEKEYKQYTVDKITIKENETPQAYIKITTKIGFSTKVYADIYMPKDLKRE